MKWEWKGNGNGNGKSKEKGKGKATLDNQLYSNIQSRPSLMLFNDSGKGMGIERERER